MQNKAKHFQEIKDDNGNLAYVKIDSNLWAIIKNSVTPCIEKALNVLYPPEKPEPLEDWKEFLECWDFKYPEEAKVLCKNCGLATEDWLSDPKKPFRLKSASISGLVVFECSKCKATVRKKHFKDKICYESSISDCGC
ncbi:hypothetical protein [Desulfovibrio litoralis]|uniref:Uncharacterized protein n=1 Tax=Desulfovibrio litoralis DSM 11393 TaxID=1121455 RepID=A0A1M7TKY4_9BACT|nr:hypothetical protein [Desulfovibrio litoralis]SHN71384.1 hypothetical protein SAMN02745728_02175 [Desulfovibrio litoralis DSM 11393]